MRTLIVRRSQVTIGETARRPWPVKLVVESRSAGAVAQRVNGRKKDVLVISRDQTGAIPHHFTGTAMNCRRLNVQCRGRTRHGGQALTAVGDAANDRLAGFLLDTVLQLAPQKEGSPGGSRLDLRRGDANRMQVLPQPRQAT